MHSLCKAIASLSGMQMQVTPAGLGGDAASTAGQLSLGSLEARVHIIRTMP